jgi:hypothetical protein
MSKFQEANICFFPTIHLLISNDHQVIPKERRSFIQSSFLSLQSMRQISKGLNGQARKENLEGLSYD